jgi:NAD(P)-dependent dehydrogenase (short-subunit alcohol dehydrogenase family)
MHELKGRVAFITGGTSGIGLGIAKALGEAGMRLMLTYRREQAKQEALSYFAAHPHIDVRTVQLDVRDREAVERAARETVEAFGSVHLLCNSAAVSLIEKIDTATHEDWDWIFDTNVKGVANVLVSFVPLLKAHGEGGHIMNVASMGSFISGAYAGVYSASKFALRGIAESLRFSLAPHRISVSLVCPGLTRTGIFRSIVTRPRTAAGMAEADDSYIERMEKIHAAGMDPDEVGRRALAGLLRGDFYIFTHPEFREELREVCEEVTTAFPEEDPGEAPRLVYEAERLRRKAEARRAVESLRAPPWEAGATP